MGRINNSPNKRIQGTSVAGRSQAHAVYVGVMWPEPETWK